MARKEIRKVTTAASREITDRRLRHRTSGYAQDDPKDREILCMARQENIAGNG